MSPGDLIIELHHGPTVDFHGIHTHTCAGRLISSFPWLRTDGSQPSSDALSFSGHVCGDKYSFHLPYKFYHDETKQKISNQWFETWTLHMLTIIDQISCLPPCKCSGGVTDAIPGCYWFHHRALSIKEKRTCDSIFLWKGRCSPSSALSITPPTPVSLLSLYSVFHFRH